MNSRFHLDFHSCVHSCSQAGGSHSYSVQRQFAMVLPFLLSFSAFSWVTMLHWGCVICSHFAQTHTPYTYSHTAIHTAIDCRDSRKGGLFLICWLYHRRELLYECIGPGSCPEVRAFCSLSRALRRTSCLSLSSPSLFSASFFLPFSYDFFLSYRSFVSDFLSIPLPAFVLQVFYSIFAFSCIRSRFEYSCCDAWFIHEEGWRIE